MLGATIRQQREAAGLSLREVAIATNGDLTPGGLSLIENGQRYPTLRTIEALACALRVRFVVSPRGVTVEKTR